MNPEGSRIGIIFNGAPLFTGDAGSGESEIRKWIIENDWLECIVQLPERMFFNTGITTYFWIVTNKKSQVRQGKVQLINASTIGKSIKKNLGDKSVEIDLERSNELFETYEEFKENEYCKILPNNFFGYTKICIEQPIFENGTPIKDKKGNFKPDPKKRDFEKVPLTKDLDEYIKKEVEPYLSNFWLDRSKDKVGYEINFTQYFYKYLELRDPEIILEEISEIDKDISNITNEFRIN